MLEELLEMGHKVEAILESLRNTRKAHLRAYQCSNQHSREPNLADTSS